MQDRYLQGDETYGNNGTSVQLQAGWNRDHAMVEKVIAGGYDDEGNADPSMITFVYKTGFEDKKKGDVACREGSFYY